MVLPSTTPARVAGCALIALSEMLLGAVALAADAEPRTTRNDSYHVMMMVVMIAVSLWMTRRLPKKAA